MFKFAFVILLFAVAYAPRAASAADLSGLYLQSSASSVFYLDLTDAAGVINGTATEVTVKVDAPDGVGRVQYNVRGTSTGNRAALELFDGPNITFSRAHFRMTVAREWGSLRATVTVSDGSIREFTFRRASANNINAVIGAIAASGQRNRIALLIIDAREQQIERRHAIQGDLTNARQSLVTARSEKPLMTTNIKRAQTKLDEALSTQKVARDAAEWAMARAETVIANADALANAATTNDARQAAYRQRSDGYTLRGEAYSLQGKVYTEDARVRDAERELGDARNSVAHLNEMIDTLSARVSRDSVALDQKYEGATA